jgi:hypothetical protein
MIARTSVLVSGGAGFLGSHLCERRREAGHEGICLDNFETIIAVTGSPSKLALRPLPQDDPRQRRPDVAPARGGLGQEPRALGDGTAEPDCQCPGAARCGRPAAIGVKGTLRAKPPTPYALARKMRGGAGARGAHARAHFLLSRMRTHRPAMAGRGLLPRRGADEELP